MDYTGIIYRIVGSEKSWELCENYAGIIYRLIYRIENYARIKGRKIFIMQTRIMGPIPKLGAQLIEPSIGDFDNLLPYPKILPMVDHIKTLQNQWG